jgi:hypothetical protein
MTAGTTTATDGSGAGPGCGADASAVERALAAAVADGTRLGELLDALSRGRLWVPLPDDGRPVTDGSAVLLPAVTYLGRDFLPAFTSAVSCASRWNAAPPRWPGRRRRRPRRPARSRTGRR